MQKNVFVTADELKIQAEYSDKVSTILSARFPDRSPLAYVHTYGCQGNVSDSERIKGMLEKMGYTLTDSLEKPDLVLYNTCAIREHAEDRVFGNVGELKRLKKDNPQMVIALCGCMMQQPHIAEKIRNSYPYVNLVFGTHVMHKLPEYLSKVLCGGRRVFDTSESDGVIAEGIPVSRDNCETAWLPIMYGCNNFCSYCVVPYVRGRERSRMPGDIIREANEILSGGCVKITLLGQNVNSYGKGCDFNTDFSQLITMLDELPYDFTFDFMTSHPKDCSQRLIDTLATSKHFCGHLHLPVQCGNNRILKEMNRGYTREKYLELISYAKNKIKNLSLTTDIIVGFPSETYEEFCDTLSLVEQVRFDSMFTFIFSARKGTKAYSMKDEVSKPEKTKWFMELLALQEKIQKDKKSV